ALMILFYDPFSLEEASFQLSFAAVAAIMLIVPPLLRRFGSNDPELSRASRLRLWLIGAVAVTVAATIGTMPLLLYHFHRIATVSVAANLIIEPLICLWAMVLGLIALPLLPVSLTAADLLLHAGGWALIAAAAVASYVSSLPFSSIWLPSPAPWLMILYYLILAIWLAPPATAFGRRPLIGVAFVCCLLSFFLPLTPLSDRFKDQDRISVLDVGHGNGVLVELRDGRKILIDGGSRSSPGFDCGTALLAPYLWHRGIAHLDDIIISHADADHYNGVPAVLKRFTVDRLWLPYLDCSKPGYTHLCRLARQHGVTLLFPKGGVFIEGEGYRFIAAGTAIGAPAERRWITASDATEDDNGLVVLLQTPLFSMLFPGDIGRARERELLASHASLQAELMVASHHGSATSNSPAFLTAVSPKQLIVSSGDRDGSLFPSESLRSFVHRHRTTLLTTVEHGTLVIVGTDDGYRIHSFKDGRWTMGEPDSGLWITPR
ncbi:MAG: ComEC/Rec2 family competence protein, partial [Desulfofustis sp.]|nr:ComEC/Rec2 family competence protein [Desulfofustis sp.]